MAPNSNKSYSCQVCGKKFARRFNLKRHYSVHLRNQEKNKCTKIKKKYICDVCKKKFTDKYNLKRHVQIHFRKKEKKIKKVKKKHICAICFRKFSTKYTLARHIKKVHNKVEVKIECKECGLLVSKKNFKKHLQSHIFTCDICNKQFEKKYHLANHKKTHEEQARKKEISTEEQNLDKIKSMCDAINIQEHEVQTAFNGKIKVYEWAPYGVEKVDLLTFQADIFDDLLITLKLSLDKFKGIKFYISTQLTLVKMSENDDRKATPNFNSICQQILLADVHSIEDMLLQAFNETHLLYENYLREGSNWTLDNIDYVRIHVFEYNPLKGSSYIALPQALSHPKKKILNIKNLDDEKCFMWSVLAHLHPAAEQSDSVQSYAKYQDELDFTGIDFPVEVSKIPKFEKQNKICINCFCYDEDDAILYPAYITKFTYSTHIDLLLYVVEDVAHYCLIKDFNSLMFSITKSKTRKYFCKRCLNHYKFEHKLLEHINQCSSYNPTNICLPKPGEEWMYFNSWGKTQWCPFVIYADMECILPKTNGKHKDNTLNTSVEQVHEPCGICYLITGPEEYVSMIRDKPFLYTGDNAVEVFLENLFNDGEKIMDILNDDKPMKMTAQDKENYAKASTCHICKKYVVDSESCADHCHLTGQFRGKAHKKCNIKYSKQKKIPVIFHNGKNYDTHFIFSKSGNALVDRKLYVIPQNTERYLTFSIDYFNFIDSYAFLHGSLSTLVENLYNNSPDNFKYLIQNFPNEEQRNLLYRKGTYPYETMTSFEEFEKKNLPTKDEFYSSLTQCGITEDEYQHAQDVFNTFKMKNMKQYHDLYLLADTLQLADCFQFYRQQTHETYQLDPVWYLSVNQLAWDAALKTSNIKLQLLTDYDMYIFVEKAIRGGLSICPNRFYIANNKNCENYDDTQVEKSLLFLDINNLYGMALSSCLPSHGFKWLTKQQIDKLHIINIANDNPIGYILEVDLDYPSHLHDYHNDLPLAPEKVKLTEDCLSDFSKQLLKDLNIKYTPCEKLIPTLNNKKNYVVHYVALKTYIQLGLVVTKVHKCLSFSQSAFFKQYIEKNTKLRSQSKDKFSVSFYKLMNNTIYGKALQNNRKRCNFKLISNDKMLTNMIKKPTFKAVKIFSENLVGVHSAFPSITLGTPITIGFSVLDISKSVVYDLFYNQLKPLFDNPVLLYQDTDCYLLGILKSQEEVDSILVSLFDTSNYPIDSPLFSNIKTW